MIPEQKLLLPLYEKFLRDGKKGEGLSTDELVNQTLNFVEKLKIYGLGETLGTIFFLDKSARPLGYMVKKLIPVFYPKIKQPVYRYINIGRKRDLSKDYPYEGDESLIGKIYGPFIPQGNILLIDEFSHTGNSLNYAQDLIQRAFPDRKVFASVAYNGMPNWYNNPFYLGVIEKNSLIPTVSRSGHLVAEFIEGNNILCPVKRNLFFESRKELNMVIKEIIQRRVEVMV